MALAFDSLRSRETHSARAILQTRRDIWKYLKTTSVVPVCRGGCYWHLGKRTQGRGPTPHNGQDVHPQQRTIQPNVSTTLRLGDPEAEQKGSVTGVSLCLFGCGLSPESRNSVWGSREFPMGLSAAGCTSELPSLKFSLQIELCERAAWVHLKSSHSEFRSQNLA